jgi:thiol-disulfide isomerase/thioredoxin
VTDIAAPSSRRGRWAGLAALFVFALALMAILQARRTETGAGVEFVEMASSGPAKLSAFVDAAGAPVSIEAFRGKTVILNLWAPWCVPCLTEMPSLDRLAARLPENRFAIVAVTKDPVGPSPSRETFERMGLKRLQLYLDPEGKLATEVGARGFPTTVILGPDGAPLAWREGAADWDSDAMVARLERLGARSKSLGQAVAR